MTLRASLVLAALVAAAVTTAAAQPVTTPLEPFTAISVCLPFNLAIGPSQGTTYELTVDADAGVAAAVNATVTNGVLTLALNGNAKNVLTFQAPNPIKAALLLPADQLASIAVSSVPSIVVAVARGFTVPAFSASLSGTSTLSVQGLTADSVQTINAGAGTLLVEGKFNTASATSSGTGTTFLVGVAQTAAVGASGISKIYVSGTAQTQITGQISGISNVYYDQGICTVSSEFGSIFGSPCTQEPITPPPYLTAPVWSCALSVYGSFGCSSGTSSVSSTTGGSSSSSSSSSSGGGNTYTSNTVNGVTTTSSGNQNADGTSSLVTDTATLQMGACPITGNELSIWPTV